MRAKILFASALPILFIVAGCSSNKEQIVFSDESTARQLFANNAIVPPPPKKQSKKLVRSDELKIREAVFSYLLSRHFWDDGYYSAVFIQGDVDEVESLIKKFSNHVPPVKPSYLADLPPNRTPTDKDTGKPAMILSADVGEPNSDESVDAIGKWYAGGAMTGFYAFVFTRSGGDWVLQSVR